MHELSQMQLATVDSNTGILYTIRINITTGIKNKNNVTSEGAFNKEGKEVKPKEVKTG